MNEFERLFNRLYPRVKLFAMQLLKHEDEAEDVAQNVFAKLWEMPEKWSEDNVDNYVFVMTRNHVLNLIRYHKLHESGGVNSDDNADATNTSNADNTGNVYLAGVKDTMLDISGTINTTQDVKLLSDKGIRMSDGSIVANNLIIQGGKGDVGSNNAFEQGDEDDNEPV